MTDSTRRTVLATAAAAAATTTARAFAQAPQAAAPQGLPAGLKVGFYEKGDVRIRYAEITVFPWKEPAELKARIINRARAFLKRHQTA